MLFPINFITNILVILFGALALIVGISIFPATKKYKIAAITSTHSKNEWLRISSLERTIAVFYLIIFLVVLIAVFYNIATFGPQIAIWETDIWYYPLFVVFIPFAAISVCSAVILPLLSKAKNAELCSGKNNKKKKNPRSGLTKKSVYAVCNYSIFVCVFNMLAGAAIIVLTFLKFFTSTAIFADNEFIQISMACIIILSFIFVFALSILMSAKSNKSKYKVSNLINFMKAEYIMNKDQVLRTKGWNTIFVFAHLFGLIALFGFIGITLVWFMAFDWANFNIHHIITLDDFKKQILIYVSYGLAGSAALSLIFSLISIASLKHYFYNTRILFSQNQILSLLGIIASTVYIVIDLRITTIFNPISTIMSIGKILIIISLFTLIPGLIAYLVLTGQFFNKQREKFTLLYPYIKALNKNKLKEKVVSHDAKQQPVVLSTSQSQPTYSNTPPIYVNVTSTQPSNERESAKKISELQKEIAELKKTIKENNAKPVITIDQIENIPAYVGINRIANEKSTIYPIWKNRKGLKPRFNKKKFSPKKKSTSKKSVKIVFKERGFFKRKTKKD